jgi:beta-glucosidase
MKKFFLSSFIISLLLFSQVSCINKASKDTRKVFTGNTPEELLSQMTLAEKIGQMTQAERNDLRKGDVKEYSLGSVLSGGGSTPANNTPEGWLNMINGFVEESMQTRLGIPVLYGLDAVHGHNNAKNAVMFPHNIGLGAIAVGSLELGKKAAYTVGRITAEEMLATGVRWTFSPVLGVAEDIRWGRTYESFSENIEIVTVMGTQLIKGLQDNGAAACMKHYLG